MQQSTEHHADCAWGAVRLALGERFGLRRMRLRGVKSS